jgi:hypothetical protein
VVIRVVGGDVMLVAPVVKTAELEPEVRTEALELVDEITNDVDNAGPDVAPEPPAPDCRLEERLVLEPAVSVDLLPEAADSEFEIELSLVTPAPVDAVRAVEAVNAEDDEIPVPRGGQIG